MSYPYEKCISSIEKGRHKYITYELEYPNRKKEFIDYIIPVLQEEYGINIEEKIKQVNSSRTKIIKKFLQGIIHLTQPRRHRRPSLILKLLGVSYLKLWRASY